MKVAALLLAAGRSTRFGAANKLVADFAGKPMLLHAIAAARQAGLAEIVVVTGHEPEQIGAALAGESVILAHNPDYASGLASSLRVGLAHLPEQVEAAFILLGDMPRVRPETLRRLMEAADKASGPLAFVPVHAERWGNPLLIRRGLFGLLATLSGDQGARRLLEKRRDIVESVAVDDPGIFADFDTQDALAAAVGGDQ